MKSVKPTTSTAAVNDLFYPVEHAFLSDWFGLERPGSCRQLDIHSEPADGLGIWVEARDVEAKIALDNAVARLVLGSVQNRLPQVGFVSADHKVTLGRQPIPGYPRGVLVLPQFLFEINWADSAPGVSWPETYHATFLPIYDRYIVTAAQDSVDIWGVTEIAIGSFARELNLLEGAKGVITDFWRMQLDQWGQDHWEHLWEPGLVSDEQAYAWAAEVWCDPEEEVPL